MVPFRMVLREVTEARLDQADLMRHKDRQPPHEKRMAVITMLNYFEEIGIAVKRQSANEDRLYDFFSGILLLAWGKLEDLVKNERNVDNEQLYYSELEWLYDRWRIRKN